MARNRTGCTAETANLFYYQSLYRNQLEELAQTERYAWMGHDMK